MDLIIERISENNFALLIVIAAAITIASTFFWGVYSIVKVIIAVGADISDTRQVKDDVKPIIKEWPKLTSDVDTLKTDNKELKSDVSTLKSDNVVLKSDVKELKSDVSTLKSDNVVLKSDVKVLKQDVGTLKVDVGILKSDVGTLKTNFGELNKKMDVVIETVSNINGVKVPFFGSNSPTVLNDRGKRIAKFINAESIADEHFNQVKFEKETGYAIQVACFDFARTELPKKISDEQLEIMKEAAFREGIDEVNHIFPIFAIPMRDKILAEKGISLDKKLEDG